MLGTYTPNINSEVLPLTLKTAFATGAFNRVPIVNGTNHDEWRLFVALSELEGGLTSSPGAPLWPRFNHVTQPIQSLVPPVPQTENNFAASHKCAFWAAA